MSPRRQLGLSITFVDDDAVMARFAMFLWRQVKLFRVALPDSLASKLRARVNARFKCVAMITQVLYMPQAMSEESWQLQS